MREIALKDEVRSRFERHIAAELDAKPEVETRTLATDFYAAEKHNLEKIASAWILNMLVKWADDILGQSVGRELLRNGHAQLTLPLSLRGIEVPSALSFVGGANRIKWVADYKVEWFHVEAHAYLMRKKADDVRLASTEFDRVVEAVRPVMEPNPKMRLPEALKKLIEAEGNGY